MSTKFEQLLDYLVNEEHEKANELFHEIVVEKSRTIYENLIAEEDKEMDETKSEDDEEMDEAKEEDDEEMDESREDDEEMDESEELEDSYNLEADDGFGGGEEGDATDDLGSEVGAEHGEDGEEHEKSEDDAIFDIKNAIEELEAAFAELEKAQGSEEADMGMDSEFGDEGEADQDEDMMMGLREYREMVKDGHGAEKKGAAEGGIAGANTGEKMPSGTNARSTYNQKADSEKPTSGANAKNLNQSNTGEGVNTGTTPNGKTGGLSGNVKGEFTKGVEKNISSSSKSSMKDGAALNKQGSGYPGNNKSAGPVGSGTGDKAGQTSVRNDSSLIKHIK
jgi:hypothetical protein